MLDYKVEKGIPTLELFSDALDDSGYCQLHININSLILSAFTEHYHKFSFRLQLSIYKQIHKKLHLKPYIVINLDRTKFKSIYEDFKKIGSKNRLGVRRNFRKHLNRFIKKYSVS